MRPNSGRSKFFFCEGRGAFRESPAHPIASYLTTSTGPCGAAQVSPELIQSGGLIIMKNVTRTFGIVLLTSAVSAGVALLLAPYSGEKTRRLVRFKMESCAKDLRDEIRTNAIVLRDRGTQGAMRAFKRLDKLRQMAA